MRMGNGWIQGLQHRKNVPDSAGVVGRPFEQPLPRDAAQNETVPPLGWLGNDEYHPVS